MIQREEIVKMINAGDKPVRLYESDDALITEAKTRSRRKSIDGPDVNSWLDDVIKTYANSCYQAGYQRGFIEAACIIQDYLQPGFVVLD